MDRDRIPHVQGTSPHQKTTASSENPLLRVEDLETYYPIKAGILAKTIGHVRAVDGVSFTIQSGETLGLVGESGCGKTTLGRTLVGLETARGGRIYFRGTDLRRLDRRRLRTVRRRMQMIFQDPLSALNPRMNTSDILTEGLVHFNLLQEDRTEAAVRLLREVGLDRDALYRYPHEFSGGQRQRINIARAISLRPDLIVGDEPVSALDVSVQAQILNLLTDLQERHRLSYLFITHDLSAVSSIADRIAVMYLGKIVESGAAADVIAQPLHPYTRALLQAVPTPGRATPSGDVLRGETPSASRPPKGCRFHPRCPHVMHRCRRQAPAAAETGGHQVWCHLYGPPAVAAEG